jgi:hypothetical protein
MRDAAIQSRFLKRMNCHVGSMGLLAMTPNNLSRKA